MSIDDVNFSHVEDPKALIRRFESRDLDAIATWTPWSTIAARSGTVIARTAIAVPPDIVDVLYCTDISILENSKELMYELFSAWDYGVEQIRSGGHEIDNQLAQFLILTPEEVGIARNGVRFFNSEENRELGPNWGQLVDRISSQAKIAGHMRTGHTPAISFYSHLLNDYIQEMALR